MMYRRAGYAVVLCVGFSFDAQGVSQTYLYDADGRIIGVEYSTGEKIFYPVNDVGNRTDLEKEPGPGGALGFSVGSISVDEKGGSVVLSVRRTGGSSGAASVTCSTSNGTAMAGNDYTATNRLLSWSAGDSTPKTCSVPITNNALLESTEAFTVSLLNPNGASPGDPSTVTVSIIDDDGPSRLWFSTSALSVPESNGTAPFTIFRTGLSQLSASVTCAASNGTATAGSDYTGTNATVSWGLNDSAPKTCTVPITNDSAMETDETFRVSLSGAIGATIEVPSLVTATILDDDGANAGTLAFVGSTAQVAEDGGSVALSVVRIGSTNTTARVDCSTSPSSGTATVGSDYAATNVTLNWGIGDSSTRTCSVPILDDDEGESNETFIVRLTNVAGAAVGNPSSVTVTINEDGDPSTLAFAMSAASVSENAGSVTVAIERTGNANSLARATCSTGTPGTATAGSDYTTTNMELLWNAGDSNSKTCTVPIIGDAADESNETFTIALSNPSGATIGSPAAVTVTVIDDGSLLQFTSATASVLESDGNIVLSVTRAGNTDAAASVICSTTGGTAAADSDYTTTNTTLNWSAGQGGAKTCTIPILNNSTLENNETFTVSLSVASGAVLANPSSTTVTIVDDDHSTTSFSSATASVAEDGGSVTLAVNRSPMGSSIAASVVCSTSNGTATVGSDYTATSTTLSWAAGESGTRNCTIPILNNSTAESDETFTATLSSPSGTTIVSPSSATVTITDDDTRIQFTSSSASVLESDGSVSLSVTRTGNTTAASVDCSTSGGTATAGSDYTTTSTTLSWSAGQTGAKACTIPILNNPTSENNETFTVSLSNASGALLGNPKSATVTIVDDDNSTTSFGSATATVAENEGSVTLAVNRSHIGSSGAASVVCSTSNGTATAGSDYTTTSTTLSWAAGESGTRNCTIPILNDATAESNETFTATLSSPSGTTIVSPASATVTITDEDTQPSVLAFSSSSYTKMENIGTSVTITVTRSQSTSGAVSVQYATQSGTAVAGQDYNTKSGTLNWAAGDSASKTFTVTVINDSTPEGDETFSVVLSNPTGGATLGTPSTTTVTIPCNDGFGGCD